jgi:hypothetical protein
MNILKCSNTYRCTPLKKHSMLRYICLVSFFLIFNSTFSQVTQIQDSVFTDTTHYNTYLNSIEGVSFNYPFDWDTTRIGPQYIFTAMEKQITKKDKFRENLIFGKVEISANLDFLLKSAITSLKANNVEYATLKYPDHTSNIDVLTTNIYFRNGKYAYYIVIGCESGEAKKYNQVFDKIIESIKLTN